MKLKLMLIPGIFVILLYCIFTVISIALFPPPFSPLDNWLSDLGNSSYNPNGAVFYNIGCVLTGAALILFYISLYKWYRDKLWHKILMVIIQIIGCYSGFALTMIGVFSEDFIIAHIYWSNVFFLLNLIVLIFSGIVLLLHPKFLKIASIYGIGIGILNLVFLFLISAPILEWFTVFTALGYVALILYSTNKIIG
jgi:hypothetical membrane protein